MSPDMMAKSWMSFWVSVRVRLAESPNETSSGVAFIATRKDTEGRPETLGVVCAAADPDNASAEFAIIVRSDLKGQGLGSLLMDKMIRYCRDRGIGQLIGEVLKANRGMQALARRFGFVVSPGLEKEVLSLSLRLG